ncbi:MAG: hypothetical protein COT24_03785 [Candidatus Kerfeldbacteria bacterium CG08_land_8_20_14_0_20_40_16]|uniref:Uncharacterized protein n=1 Tax=Candidatus Kerfeldbacteria bacterium CG08_land_8_20_14_0_20_40_16 TaxID=2014244 RepID=A0A2H0YV80_9BACT|nr:MAG: hypothetical protein COT24_03785 [Candidatus Kerfeldbacteria bacterium CG08_land_8_20_14_0_20_40_16]
MSLTISRPLKLIKSKSEIERIGLNDIQALRKLLEVKNRKDLSILLKDCSSYLEESSQYGSYLFSILSTFWIYVPPEKIEEAENISKQDMDFLLELVRKIYPPKDNAPEITELKFRVRTEVNTQTQKSEKLNKEKSKNTEKKKTEKWFTMDNPLVWLIFSLILIVISYFIYKVQK